ncbi:MAG: PH domain-containing protein [Pseudomonadota bacterium]
MAYVKRTLAEGEHYLYRAHFNWTYDAQSLFWFLLGALPALVWVFAVAQFDAAVLGRPYLFLTGVSFALGSMLALQRYVRKWTTVVAVTSERLILKTGLIARSSHEIMLDEIEEVFVAQPFWGRIAGFGQLEVRGTGNVVIEFPILGEPIRVRHEIETAVVQARKAPAGRAS